MNEMLARIEAGHAAQRRFVGDASHELRSPLTAIISALDVAVAHPELLDLELAKDTLAPEAQRMRILVEDLLLLARADEIGLALQREPVRLDDIARSEVIRLRRTWPHVVDVHTEPVELEGDRNALSRVVRNLLDNAARHAVSRIDVTVHRRLLMLCSPLPMTVREFRRRNALESWRDSFGSTKIARARAAARGSVCPSPSRLSLRTWARSR